LEQSERALRLDFFPALADRGPLLYHLHFTLFNLRIARFVVRGTRPHGAEKLQKASDSPRKIRPAGTEAYAGILRSKIAASAFSKHRPKHSDARVSFSSIRISSAFSPARRMKVPQSRATPISAGFLIYFSLRI
jgi:hypothetical protein